MVADLRKLSFNQIHYYLEEIARDREEYLSGHGEAPGRWYGKAAEGLGLYGLVEDEAFVKMFQGLDPRTGEQLGRAHGVYGDSDRRQALPALDLTLRPTKDVSVVWGLADDRERKMIEAAFREAVGEAVVYLEAATGTRMGKGGREHVAAEGLMIAGFRHRTSRTNDPLLHEHLIIANRAQGPDGKWRTLDARDLWDARRAVDAMFTAQLEYALSRDLGIEFTEADRHGIRQIRGISEASRRHFSKRTQKIDKDCELALAQKVATGKHAKLSYHEIKEQVLKSRPAKQHIDMDRLHDRWSAEDAEHGLHTREDVQRVLAQGRARRQRGVPQVADLQEALDELAGPAGLTEQRSTFTRHDVVQALQARLGGRLPARELARLAEGFLADSSRSLPTDLSERQPRWTTPAARQLEETLLQLADAPGTGRQASAEALADALGRYTSLGEDQRQAVTHITRGTQAVTMLVGRPGTGKTFMVNAARHAFQRDGVQVAGAAPTGNAAVGLQAGARLTGARTIDSLLMSLEQPGARPEAILPRDGVLFVDEAGQVGTRNLTRLAEAARQVNTKVVLIGDHMQLQSIDMGGGFRALRERLGAAELTENRRQKDPLERQASEMFRQGEGEQALQVLAEAGHVRIVPDRATREHGMLARWWELHTQQADVDILTPLRAEAERFNRLARLSRQAAGELGGEELVAAGRRLAVGDRIVCRRNALRRLGISNGDVGKVTALDAKAGSVTVRLEEGAREVTLPRSYLRTRTAHGDPAVDYAYARTGDSSQGATNGYTLVHAIPGHGDQHYWHVVGSRARERTEYWAEAEPEPLNVELRQLRDDHRPGTLTRLAEDASKSRDQQLSVDTVAGPDVHTMPLGDLRAERADLEAQLAQNGGDRREGRRLQLRTQRAQTAHQQAQEQLAEARQQAESARQSLEQAPRGWRHRSRTRELETRAILAEQQATTLQQQATRAQEQVMAARVPLDRWQATQERTAPQRTRMAMLGQELADRQAARRQALAVDPPRHLTEALGRYDPAAPAGERRRWTIAAQKIQDYRERHGITDHERALGDQPQGDLGRARQWASLRREARELAEETRDPHRHQRRQAREQRAQRGRQEHQGRSLAG